VFNVRPCGTCSFFWPSDPGQQPYGPYAAFDFRLDAESTPTPDPSVVSFPWLVGTTQPPSFPDPEVMDGCRKAPIMTLGINPNLTAFAPGPTGASWAYPSFTSDAGEDEWAKYAYYYRYRSVYQERFDFNYARKYLVPGSEVVADRPGTVSAADRLSSAPSFVLNVRYDGDTQDTSIPLEATLGGPQWVVLFDTHEPTNRFAAGDVLAAKLSVPAGESVQVYRQQVGYYEQFVPTLKSFDTYLRTRGYAGAPLQMGEDVCQLDMVACASPHWTPAFLGGTPTDEHTIINNCVLRNGWVIKQLVQTQPAVLYLVGEATFNMFWSALGRLLVRTPELTSPPPDGAFTLLRETTDPNRRTYLEFSTEVDGRPYTIRTRLVVTPHFSYNVSFEPQIRLSPSDWATLQANGAGCAQFLQQDSRIAITLPQLPQDFVAFQLLDPAAVFAEIHQTYREWEPVLASGYYDPHTMMASALQDEYQLGNLEYQPSGTAGQQILARTAGPCRFCVNDHWTFPQGCPYDKPAEPALPIGYLEQVASKMLTVGRPPGLPS